jgi:uncharacterized membrane-anchored protein
MTALLIFALAIAAHALGWAAIASVPGAHCLDWDD